MTLTAAESGISIVDGNLRVHHTTLLSKVPPNISLIPAQAAGGQSSHGAFIGASSTRSSHHHVFPLGIFQGFRFMCCFRFKLWWMIQRMGTCGREIPFETQFLLVESKDISSLGSAEQIIYTVFLPLLEGPFRASLQGNEQNLIELCVESGDLAVQTLRGDHAILVHAGVNPFQVISDAVRSAEMHLGTFHHREKKKMPRFLDWFGWCTWDAFYHDITAAGVKEGIQSLATGGTPPRFVIIDDGWQSVATDHQPVTCTVSNGKFYESRLTHIKENYKFQKDGKDGQRIEDPTLGLQHIVNEIKEKNNLKYVYIWHAITGYWGGVKPGIPGMEHYESTLRYPSHSPSILENAPDHYFDYMSAKGLGLIHPNKIFHFYNDLHSYLAAIGIDGVKVDVQNVLETLGAGFGGRVSITRKYHEALEASIARNFPDNGCISCMSHNTDSLYSSKQTALVRASDDFWPRDPASHTIHIASVAYNSLFLGEFMQPDWDMFHSLHPAAEYHAAARAVGGCAVYISDKPGNHNFDILRKLVLPDGSVLRAQLPGRPSRDCLFADPTRDGKSLLKIWNINNYTGVLGVFNCQGAGWCRINQKNMLHDTEPSRITGSVYAQDVDLISNVAPHDWNGDCIMYGHRQGEVVCIPKGSSFPITLTTREYEVFTVVPIKEFSSMVSFAPIGLIRMLNAGGAIKFLNYAVEHTAEEDEFVGKPNDEIAYLACKTLGASQPCFGQVRMKICGCGEFAIYSSSRPKSIIVDSKALDFSYDFKTGIATLMLPVPEEEGYLWNVEVQL